MAAPGFPITAVLTPSKILASEHAEWVRSCRARSGCAPSTTRYFVVDGKRAGSVSGPGQDEPRWLADPARCPRPQARWRLSIRGLRFLDLGIIVAAAKPAVRHDAEVIRSVPCPDGLRRARCDE